MTIVMNELPVPVSLTEELTRMQTRIEDLTAYKAQLQSLIPFGALIHSRLPSGFRSYWISSTDLKNSPVILAIYLPVSGFTIKAAPELAEFLEFLSDYYDKPPTSMDEPQNGSRAYIFKPEPLEYNLSVHVNAELKTNSKNCERIITGVQTVSKMVYVEVEEPVYAFKC